MHHEARMTEVMGPYGSSSEAEFLSTGFGLTSDMKNDEVLESIGQLREETLARFVRDADALVARSGENSNERAFMIRRQLASAWTVVALSSWFRGKGSPAFLILWSMMAIEACLVLERASLEEDLLKKH